MAEITTVSRFRGLTRTQALLVVVVTLLLMILSMTSPMTQDQLPVTVSKASASSPPQVERDPDLHLYRTINDRVAVGEGYYQVAAEEQRSQGYPLRPFITFRLPSLALMNAVLGSAGMTLLIWTLIMSVIGAWWQRLEGAFADPNRRIVAILLLGSGLLLPARAELIVVHDIWAGLLLALSFGLHREDRWKLSLCAALLAVMIRETSLPFVLLMGAAALWRRHYRESLGWGLVVLLFAGAMTLHAQSVAAVVTPADPSSQGWASFAGWPFFIFTFEQTTALRATPGWVSAILIPLAMLGWASWRTLAGCIGTLLIAGYAIIFMALGRPENFYWGLAIAPLFLVGLAFVPIAIPDLMSALRRDARAGLSS
jgi:hypothetical protein